MVCRLVWWEGCFFYLAGSLKENEGRFDEALHHLRQALEIARQVLPEGHPDIATTLNNITDLLDIMGRRNESQRHAPDNSCPTSNDLDQCEEHSAETGRKVGRNEPCPCGSGKHYKQCCGVLS